MKISATKVLIGFLALSTLLEISIIVKLSYKADYQLEATKSEIILIDSETSDTIYRESLNSGSGIVEAILKDNL